MNIKEGESSFVLVCFDKTRNRIKSRAFRFDGKGIGVLLPTHYPPEIPGYGALKADLAGGGKNCT